MRNPLTDVDGGAAFPSAPHQARMNDSGVLEPFGFEGMSLRDWFAGQALAGCLASLGYDGDCDIAAKDAYAFADAMLAARTGEA